MLHGVWRGRRISRVRRDGPAVMRSHRRRCAPGPSRQGAGGDVRHLGQADDPGGTCQLLQIQVGRQPRPRLQARRLRRIGRVDAGQGTLRRMNGRTVAGRFMPCARPKADHAAILGLRQDVAISEGVAICFDEVGGSGQVGVCHFHISPLRLSTMMSTIILTVNILMSNDIYV